MTVGEHAAVMRVDLVPDTGIGQYAGDERFRSTFDAAPSPMALLRLDGTIDVVNPALSAFVGRSAAELIGRPGAEMAHRDDRVAETQQMTDLLAGRCDSFVLDQRFTAADGTVRWGEKSVTVVRAAGRPSHFVLHIHDITERKRRDQTIVDERRGLTQAESLGRVGSWEMDVGTTRIRWSGGMVGVWGADLQTFGGDLAAAMLSVHPDDRSTVVDTIMACATTGEPAFVRFRLTRQVDGALRWIDTRAEAQWTDGRITRVRGAVADVTDHVEAQAAADSTQRFQEAVFAATPDTIAVWELDTSTILWSNRSITAQLGYDDAAAAAMAEDLAAHLVLKEDQAAFAAALVATRAAADGEVTQVDFRMRHRDGTPRWFSRRIAPLRRDEHGRVTQIVGISREITAEHTVAQALAESEALFRQLADSVDVAFFLRTAEPSEYLYVSPGCVKIFGYDPMAAGETPVDTLARIHPDDRDRFLREYWIPFHQGRPVRIDYRLVRPDGQVRWIRSTTAPVAHPQPGPRRFATTSEDITASRQAEAAIRAAEAAERANAAKNEFLSRMSHELRTPLNAVLGFAQLLELDPLTGDQHAGVQHILRGGRHLLGLIDDVLDISTIESDHLHLTLEPVSLSALLTENVQLMAPQALAAGVTLHLEPVPGDGVRADQRRLRQVLLNLLSNAVKYNRSGGRVVVRCRAEGGHRLHIDVTDTGRGIAERDLPRLFTPFDRLGAEHTGIEGTGVGLALSQRLTTLMGGTLTATSEVGVGSTFTVSLPSVGLPGPAPAAHRPVDGPPPAALPCARTLLYIEDNGSNVELVRQLLDRRPEWRMLVAGSGALGLQLAATGAPELVLLDLHLPDADGMDVLRELRGDPATRGMQVVVVSADASPHQQERLLEAGASAYLTKPLDVADVLALLDRPAERP